MEPDSDAEWLEEICLAHNIEYQKQRELSGEGARASVASSEAIATVVAQYQMAPMPDLLPEEVAEMEAREAKRRRFDERMEEFRSRTDASCSASSGSDRARAEPLAVGGRGVIWTHGGPANFDGVALKVSRLLVATSFNFTIGISVDPEHRFSNSRYGYRTCIGAFALIVLCQTSRSIACDLEQRLIAYFSSNPRCRNRARGGEGVAIGASTVFLYVCLGGYAAQDEWVLPRKSAAR